MRPPLHTFHLAAALLVATPLCSYAAHHYVSPTGSAAGDGTREAPYVSIEHTVEVVAAPGDTVFLLPGHYSFLGDQGGQFDVFPKAGQVITTADPGFVTLDFDGATLGHAAFTIAASQVAIEADSTSQIVFRNWADLGSAYGVVTVKPSASAITGIALEGLSFWPVEGTTPCVTVDASANSVSDIRIEKTAMLDGPNDGWGVILRFGAATSIAGVHIADCLFEGARSSLRAETALAFVPSVAGGPVRISNLLVERTTFGNWSRAVDAFWLTEASDLTFAANSFRRSPLPDCGECDAIQLPHGTPVAEDVLVHGNYFEGYDHVLDGGARQLVFRRNIAFDNRDDFVYLNGAEAAVIDSNLAVHGGNDAFDFRDVHGVVVEYNTLYDFSSALLDIEPGCTDVTVRNNILADGQNEFNEPTTFLVRAEPGNGNTFLRNIVFDPDPEDEWFDLPSGFTWDDFLAAFGLVEGVDSWWVDPLWNTTKSPSRSTTFAPLPTSVALGHSTAGTVLGARPEAIRRNWFVGSDVPTIAAAMDSAWGGDTVFVPPGSYTIANLILPRHAVLRSIGGAGVTALHAEPNARHFVVSECSSLGGIVGFTLSDGTAPVLGSGTPTDGNGGSIYILGGDPRIEGCIFTNNAAPSGAGGALFLTDGTRAAVTGCTFHANDAAQGAHAAVTGEGSAPSLERCIFAFGISGGATYADSLAAATYECCDLFGNGGGDVAAGASSESFSADPLFADAPGGLLCLLEGSPCLPDAAPCGALVGAVGACPAAGVDDGGGAVPLPSLVVAPNPFRGSVAIELRAVDSFPSPPPVFDLYDASGRRVASLTVERSSGRAAVAWDGTDARARPLPSGTYFVRVRGARGAPERLVLLR